MIPRKAHLIFTLLNFGKYDNLKLLLGPEWVYPGSWGGGRGGERLDYPAVALLFIYRSSELLMLLTFSLDSIRVKHEAGKG